MINIIRLHPTRFVISLIVIEIFASLAFGAAAFEYPTWTYYDLNLAAMQMRIDQNYSGALTLLNLAVALKPSEPESYLNRGFIYGLLHQKDRGIADELRAISLAQSDNEQNFDYKLMAHQNLAGIYLNNNENAKAEAEFKLSLSLYPDDPLTTERLATLLLKVQRKESGINHLIIAQKLYEKLNLKSDAIRVSEKISRLQNEIATLGIKDTTKSE
jgi:tetratricopeptide (TPR) repeat protein